MCLIALHIACAGILVCVVLDSVRHTEIDRRVDSKVRTFFPCLLLYASRGGLVACFRLHFAQNSSGALHLWVDPPFLLSIPDCSCESSMHDEAVHKQDTTSCIPLTLLSSHQHPTLTFVCRFRNPFPSQLDHSQLLHNPIRSIPTRRHQTKLSRS